jgi:cobalt-zinc-cadmium efflux system membrane fusion protein
LLKNLSVLAVVVLAVGALAAAIPLFGLPKSLPWAKRAPAESAPAGESTSPAESVPGRPDALRLPPDVVRALRIQIIEAQPATQPQTLELSGRLAIDANHLARVHARFGGEVVEIARVPDQGRPGGQTVLRSLRVGDLVEENQLLAVIWSRDLGEKKSELIDTLSRLHLDQEILERLQKLLQQGATSERAVFEAERAVESDRIAVDRVERTLQSWRLTESEIAALHAEAKRYRDRKTRPERVEDKAWARVEVRARLAGTILERNVTVGDIVDTTTDLFKIADVRTLAVWADAYEEDLPALLGLPLDQRTWMVRLKAEPHLEPLLGTIDYIGEIVDPTQHTALVVGRVDNRGGRLRAGQFITAILSLPPAPDEVLIPITGLIEDGRASIVFVHEDPAKPEYALRRVVVRRRLPDAVTVRSRLSPAQTRQGLQAVRPGERVVQKGALQLKKALEELQTAAGAAE